MMFYIWKCNYDVTQKYIPVPEGTKSGKIKTKGLFFGKHATLFALIVEQNCGTNVKICMFSEFHRILKG